MGPFLKGHILLATSHSILTIWEQTYNDKSTEPAGTTAMSAVDHREAPEDKDEREYPEEDPAHHVDDLAAESIV